jgi:hypothetical protein
VEHAHAQLAKLWRLPRVVGDLLLRMQEYRFLIPECLDGTSVPQPEWRMDLLKRSLTALNGGYTQGADVVGEWAGAPPERSKQFIVSISAEHEPRLNALLYLFREKFQQQAIYVASGADSWLIDHQTPRPERESLLWAREALEL